MRKPDEDLLKILFANAPDLLLRKDSEIWSQGLFTRGFMRNQEAAGLIEAYDIAGKAVYKKSDVIAWARRLYGLDNQRESDKIQGTDCTENATRSTTK